MFDLVDLLIYLVMYGFIVLSIALSFVILMLDTSIYIVVAKIISGLLI